jgi:hypothetical protein
MVSRMAMGLRVSDTESSFSNRCFDLISAPVSHCNNV